MFGNMLKSSGSSAHVTQGILSIAGGCIMSDKYSILVKYLGRTLYGR